MWAREQETALEAPKQGSSKWAGLSTLAKPTSYFTAALQELGRAGPPLSVFPFASVQKALAPWLGVLPAGRMEDEDGPEYGKPDFVLLDQLTMEDFMKNLQLR